MTAYLVDSNVLLRRIQSSSSHYAAARRALRRLYENGDILCITSQNLLEFWSVATRSALRGRLVLAHPQAERHLRRLGGSFASSTMCLIYTWNGKTLSPCSVSPTLMYMMQGFWQ